MSHPTRRGRPARHHRLRLRTERRDPIDYESLTRAAMEQAAMDQRRDKDDAAPSASTPLERQPDDDPGAGYADLDEEGAAL